MVECDIGDSESRLGLKRFDILIDADKGLEAADVDYVVAFPSGPEVFAGRPVQVNVYGPSTTDRDLLDTLVKGVGGRLDGWSIPSAWNIHVPPLD
jgi:hypothetical protein